MGVDTNTDWVILTESLPAWLSVKDVADDYVVLVAEMNDTEEKRSSNVMFSTPSETYSLNIRQNAREQLAFLGKRNGLFLRKRKTTKSLSHGMSLLT